MTNLPVDPTKININFDPTVQRMSGTATHGNTPFDVPFISEIAPNLWQGGCQNGLVLPRTFKHLISLYPWEEYKIYHEIETLVQCRMYDGFDQALEIVDDLARLVNTCMKTGPVLVHCQAGLNRSSLIVARVLMLNGLTAKGAIQRIRLKRSPACLCNKSFEKWLRNKEYKLKSKVGVQDAA
jgi:protein-tyrosine phosphatase